MGSSRLSSCSSDSCPDALTVKDIRLAQIARADVNVLFGTTTIPLEGSPVQPNPKETPYTYEVTFKAPADPPDKVNNKAYSPILLVGKTKRIIVKSGVPLFKYPSGCPAPGAMNHARKERASATCACIDLSIRTSGAGAQFV